MLIETFQYKQWADQRTLDAVRAIKGSVHPSSAAFARQQLNHMVRVEELFKARLLGEPAPHASTNTELVPGLDELGQRITISNLWFTRYAEQLEHSELDHSVIFQFVDCKQGTMTRREIFFHVVNHGTYHRGAIGHALDLAGAVRPADTYTVFIHAVEPSRREKA